MKTLAYRLADWTDFDGAMFELGIVLGLWPDEPWTVKGSGVLKGIFWAKNEIGEALYETLEAMVKGGLMDHDEEEQRFRWHPKAEYKEELNRRLNTYFDQESQQWRTKNS